MHPPIVRFEDFELDASNATLKKGGVPLKLRPQAFKILSLLVSAAGQLITRERIRQEVWGEETFVDFNQGLNVCIRQIRETLGDDVEAPRYVETVPKLGYRFIAPVGPVAAPRAEPAEEAHQASQGSSAAPRPRSRTTLPIALAAAALVVITGAAGWWWRSSTAAPPPITSIAVLPFENLSAGDDPGFVAEGVTDALINNLAQIGALKVISRTSVMTYKGSPRALPEIAKELAVDAIVEGSVRRVSDRVRVNVQLVHAATDRPVWAQTYERNASDILGMERDIARAIAIAVRASLTPREHAQLATGRTVDPMAHEAYLKGRHFWNERSYEGLSKAVKFFQEAIDRDPTYAAPYAGLADCYVLGPGLRIPVKEAYEIARTAANKALELDPDLAEAHSALGLVETFYDWDMAAARESFTRAIDLNPGYATAHQMFAEYLAINGQLDEAMTEIRRARELDPLSLIIRRDVGRIHYFARRYDEAITELLKTLEVDPSFNPAQFLLAFSYELTGRHREAVAGFEKMVSSSGGRALFTAALGYSHGIAGDHLEATKAVAQLTAPGNRRPPAYDVALVYLGIGDADRTFEWLERAVEERSYRIIYVGIEPIFDPVRHDPRFAELLERAGLPAKLGRRDWNGGQSGVRPSSPQAVRGQ